MQVAEVFHARIVTTSEMNILMSRFSVIIFEVTFIK